MQETKKDQCKVHLEVINLQNISREYIKGTGKYWPMKLKFRGINTTKTSVLEKQRTITPTSFVSVIPLQN
jgi:hypothetical protein